MRIAINAWFLNQAGTGSGQYLDHLLAAMADARPGTASGLRLLLVTPVDHPEFEVPGLDVEVWPVRSRFWTDRPRRLGKVWFEQVFFPRLCSRWGADLAHVPYWGSPLWPTVPTVVTVHDLIPLLLPAYRGGLPVRLYTRLVAASARRATAVLTDSLASQRDIIDHLGLPPERVHCIYLGIDEDFCPEPAPDDEAIRHKYGLSRGSDSLPTSRYVLYLAGHDVRKNVAGLVEAFATVARADDDVTLVIGGKLPPKDSPPFFDPRPLVTALDLEGDVRFIGWVDEAHKPALYRGAACAVFASHYEGFGLPVLEALACGTPLVTSNKGSLPELVGDAGFAMEPEDVPSLAGAILSCLVDERLAQELRQRGPKQAARFSWQKTAQETLGIYSKVAFAGRSKG
jgi:glycosyltransferase involved in cell wall biosynthesis